MHTLPTHVNFLVPRTGHPDVRKRYRTYIEHYFLIDFHWLMPGCLRQVFDSIGYQIVTNVGNQVESTEASGSHVSRVLRMFQCRLQDVFTNEGNSFDRLRMWKYRLQHGVTRGSRPCAYGLGGMGGCTCGDANGPCPKNGSERATVYPCHKARNPSKFVDNLWGRVGLVGGRALFASFEGVTSNRGNLELLVLYGCGLLICRFSDYITS